MAQGMGTLQIAEQEKSDKIILSFIENNPGTFSREIIRKTHLSSTTVTSSIKRLRMDKKIIHLKDSFVFLHLKHRFPKDRKKRLVYFDQKVEEEKKQLVEDQEKKLESLLSEFKVSVDKEREFYRSRLRELSEILAKGIQNKVAEIIQEIKKELRVNVEKINESMIGIFLYRFVEKLEIKKGGIPMAPIFYMELLPKEYTHLKFEKFIDLEQFWENNRDLNADTIQYDEEFAHNYIIHKESIPSINHKGRYESYIFPQNFLRYNKKLIQKLKPKELEKILSYP